MANSMSHRLRDAAPRHIDKPARAGSTNRLSAQQPSALRTLLAKLGRTDEARAELERAASLTHNRAEQELLRARAAAL